MHLADLPVDCTTPFKKLVRGLNTNAVTLIRLYEEKSDADSSVLLRCSGIYLSQKRDLESKRQ